MKCLYLDCFSGISGNMFLGALLNAGFPFEFLRSELAKLNLGKYSLINEETKKKSINAQYFDVELSFHDNTEHKHRTLQDIKEILFASSLTLDIKKRAVDIFTELAKAEAKVHGVSLEEVHFHEVGAIDTIIDIVGVLIGLNFLKIEKVYVSKITTGFGFIHCTHGLMPVPAPATAELLNGFIQQRGTVKAELTTPTGAVLLKTLAEQKIDLPFKDYQIFYGSGKMNLQIPNVVRCYIGECLEKFENQVFEVTCNLDDCTGEILGFTLDKLLQNGALDVWTESINMKKSRPGIKLCFLCNHPDIDKLTQIVFKETSAIGIRYHKMDRSILNREIVIAKTKYGSIRVKVAKMSDGFSKIHPEFDDCQKLAFSQGVSFIDVQRAALIALKESNVNK